MSPTAKQLMDADEAAYYVSPYPISPSLLQYIFVNRQQGLPPDDGGLGWMNQETIGYDYDLLLHLVRQFRFS
jgi:hypothetical protein